MIVGLILFQPKKGVGRIITPKDQSWFSKEILNRYFKTERAEICIQQDDTFPISLSNFQAYENKEKKFNRKECYQEMLK